MSLEKENIELITIIIALSGLILSVYNLWIDRSDKHPKLSVKLVEGLWETKRKRKETSYDGGYIVELINNGQTPINITDIRIKFSHTKEFGTLEATLKRIITTKEPITRYSTKKGPYYHISQAKILDQHTITLSNGDNAYYWISKMEIDDYLISLEGLIFTLDSNIKMKASVRIALGSTYYSNKLSYKITESNKETLL